MIRMRIRYGLAEIALDGLVGLGHERAIGLGHDLQLVAKVLQRHRIRSIAEAQCQGRANRATPYPTRGVEWRSTGLRIRPPRSCPDPLALGVPQRLPHDLGADPDPEDVDLAALTDDGSLGRQVAKAMLRPTA
jgi:hypothetical protein